MTTISNATETHRALVEELYAALAEGDVECISALLAPDFVGRLTPGLPFGIGCEHVGAAAMIRLLMSKWR